MYLNEMSNCRPRKTGLPVNIWIDEAETYKKSKHSKRIKFQINKSLSFQLENTCSMLLNGSIPEDVFQKVQNKKDYNLMSHDIEQIRNFVLNNSYALNLIADQKLDLDDFWEFCIKGGEKASKEDLNNLKRRTDYFKHEKY